MIKMNYITKKEERKIRSSSIKLNQFTHTLRNRQGWMMQLYMTDKR